MQDYAWLNAIPFDGSHANIECAWRVLHALSFVLRFADIYVGMAYKGKGNMCAD